jgi:tetratricopeptide (TPR) repeat protein
MHRWIALALTALAVALYAPALRAPFFFDDHDSILNNRLLHDGALFRAPPDTPIAGRPIAAATFAANYAFNHLDPLGYHVVNVTLHILTTLALFAVARRTLERAHIPPPRALWLAAAISALWSAHPLCTEAVTYITQRTELLFSLFLLLTLYCAIRADDAPSRPARLAWSSAAVLACALGMGSKEVMVGAPLLVMAWDRLFRDRTQPPRWVLYTALASTWLLLAFLVVQNHRTHSTGLDFAGATPVAYLRAQSAAITRYLRLSLWPIGQSLDYGETAAVGWNHAAWRMLLLGAILLASLWTLYRRRPIAFLGLGFFIILAPTSSVWPIATEWAAERRMYLPLIAVIAAAVLYANALLRRSTFAAVAAFSIALPALSIATLRRNSLYRDTLAIWNDAVHALPQNPRAHSNLGVELHRRDRLDDAEREYRIAVQLSPDYPTALANLGEILAERNRPAEAIPYLTRAVRLWPDVVQSRITLGNALLTQHRHREAEEHYTHALRLDPNLSDVANNLAWTLATSPDPAARDGDRAVRIAETTLRRNPTPDAVHLDTLAACYAEAQRWPDAISTAQRALDAAKRESNPTLTGEIAHRREAYSVHHPWRDPQP